MRSVRYPAGVKVVIAYNPVSGRGRAEAAAGQLAVDLGRADIRVRRVASRRSDAAEWLRPELGGADALVVVGGDGAVRAAAPEAARVDVPIWQLPFGTENLFARHFRMVADASVLVSALRARRVRQIDLGVATLDGAAEASDRAHFAIMASVGFDADVVHALARSRAGSISHASYVPIMLECLRSWRPVELAWEIDGEREWLGHGVIVVGNLPEYGVRLNPTPDARCDDGLLDAVFLPAESPLAAIAWMPLLRAGLHGRHPDVRFRRGARVRIEAASAARVQVDGDAVGSPDGVRSMAFRTAEQRLSVLLPPE
jgi:diacylglycerol kinase (ATP)